MPIRKYKPTTPGRRGSSVSYFAEITRDRPEKSLLRPVNIKGGRNAQGKIVAQANGRYLPRQPLCWMLGAGAIDAVDSRGLVHAGRDDLDAGKRAMCVPAVT